MHGKGVIAHIVLKIAVDRPMRDTWDGSESWNFLRSLQRVHIRTGLRLPARELISTRLLEYQHLWWLSIGSR